MSIRQRVQSNFAEEHNKKVPKQDEVKITDLKISGWICCLSFSDVIAPVLLVQLVLFHSGLWDPAGHFCDCRTAFDVSLPNAGYWTSLGQFCYGDSLLMVKNAGQQGFFFSAKKRSIVTQEVRLKKDHKHGESWTFIPEERPLPKGVFSHPLVCCRCRCRLPRVWSTPEASCRDLYEGVKRSTHHNLKHKRTWYLGETVGGGASQVD